MEFFEDPFHFDVDEAKARKEREEGLASGPSKNESNVFESEVSEALLKKDKE